MDLHVHADKKDGEHGRGDAEESINCLVFPACSTAAYVRTCSISSSNHQQRFSTPMDNRATLHDTLFSRNSTPPTSTPQHQPFTSSHISNNSSPNLIDSLFQNLSPPAPAEQHQSPAAPTAIPESHPPESYVPENYHDPSAAASVLSLPEDTAISPNTIAERQNSLLSLIGAPATNRPSQPVVQQQQPVQPQPQQVPTPPGSSQRSNASPPQSEAQKMLDQMLGG